MHSLPLPPWLAFHIAILARDERAPKKLPPVANRIPLPPLYRPLIEPHVWPSQSARRLRVSPIRTRVELFISVLAHLAWGLGTRHGVFHQT